MKYAIKLSPPRHILVGTNEWYGGIEYQFDGEKYVDYVSKTEAKRYKSKRIAERVANRLYEQCCNIFKFEIVEVEQ